MSKETLTFDYVDIHGEKSKKTVYQIGVRLGFSSYYEYEEEHWFLMAYDIDKQEKTEFAVINMSNISSSEGYDYDGFFKTLLKEK